ncbi:MAG: TIGR04076 family protein [Firmicutes bacterium]|nr:TIGR04076 family protein [Bacillota bacterium]MBR6824359.1 TIGR04076 family protein [Bacillota bacterium]
MKIKITLVEQKGTCPCHRGHKVGDVFDFDADRGKLCPMAMHTLFPMVDILRYGGTLKNDCYCCPDVDTINVFKIEKVTE